MKNGEVLHDVKEDRRVVHTVKRRKTNWSDYFLRTNCLLKQVIEGKMGASIEVMVRRGRRRKQLLDDPNKKGVYWKLKGEALNGSMRRTLSSVTVASTCISF